MILKRGFILFFFFFAYQISNSQDILEQYIPLPPQELSVAQYLYHIEQITGYPLAYSSAIVEDRTISIFTDSIPLQVLLDTLFTKHHVQYVFYDNQLILSPQGRKSVRKNTIQVSGTVRHARNGKAIPYANVYVPYESNGTICNSEGGFEMYLPTDANFETLQVGCLGYLEATVSIMDLLKGPVEISLQPLRFQIEELIVKPKDPKELIRIALARKGENYGKDPKLLTAFFREVTRQDEKYISLSEAIIDIYKTSYLKGGNDMVRLKRGRKGTNIHKPEYVNLVVEGGLYNNMRLDIMKYGISFLDPESFHYYDYEYRGRFKLNKRQTYAIDFKFRGSNDFTGFNGKLYFDIESLALIRAEFQISDESLTNAYSWLVKKVPKNQKVRPKWGRYYVEYRPYDGKWNLNYARSEISLKLRKKRERKKAGFNCQYLASSEFVITGTNGDEFERIRFRDAAKPSDVLLDEIEETDLEYWGNETVIKPEEPLLQTIQKLHLTKKTKHTGFEITTETLKK